MAYCPQTPWIVNGRLRENVLMGKEFDEELYRRALALSCLERDLDLLPGGDLAEIGEDGINVSVGQKHRIALARAYYRQPDVVLLDSPLSAVDNVVGHDIWQHLIVEEWRHRVRSVSILLCFSFLSLSFVNPIPADDMCHGHPQSSALAAVRSSVGDERWSNL